VGTKANFVNYSSACRFSAYLALPHKGNHNNIIRPLADLRQSQDLMANRRWQDLTVSHQSRGLMA